MGDISKNFNKSEFICPCCKRGAISLKLLKILQTIRDAAGVPVGIESGWRCEKHNKEVKGQRDSSHLDGLAADIYIDGWSNKRLGSLIKSLYRDGLIQDIQYCYLIKGNTNTRVHLDVDESKANKRWRVFAF